MRGISRAMAARSSVSNRPLGAVQRKVGIGKLRSGRNVARQVPEDLRDNRESPAGPFARNVSKEDWFPQCPRQSGDLSHRETDGVHIRQENGKETIRMAKIERTYLEIPGLRKVVDAPAGSSIIL